MTLNWHWWQGDRENWWEERWGCCQGWRQRKDATRRAREGPLCPNLSEICKIQFSLVIILLHTCSGSLFPSTGLFSRRVGQSRKWTLGNCCVGIALTKVNQKAHITYKTDQRSTSSGIKKLTSTERKKLEKRPVILKDGPEKSIVGKNLEKDIFQVITGRERMSECVMDGDKCLRCWLYCRSDTAVLLSWSKIKPQTKIRSEKWKRKR